MLHYAALHLGLDCLPKCLFSDIQNESVNSSQVPGHVVQTLTCLTADPGLTSSNPAQPHTFLKIDHEIISTAILLPSTDSRRVVVSFKQKYVHEVLVNRIVKLAQGENVVR